MEIQAPKNGFISSQDCTYDAALQFLIEKFPDSRIHTAYKGSGLCTYVDNYLAIKPSRFSQYGWKLCNEFSHLWEEENNEKKLNRN